MLMVQEKKIVFYFSGTGNSFKLAEDIAGLIGAKTLNIAPLLETKSVMLKSETIGFVFPVYDFKAPEVMNQFVSQLKGIESSYLFAICNYGIAPSKTLNKFQKELQKVDGTLDLGVSFQMPHNGIGSGNFSVKRHQQMLVNWEQAKSKIANKINEHKKDGIEKSKPLEAMKVFLFQGVLFKSIPTFTKLLTKVAFHGWDALAYTANENCNGCGICEKICPVHNIHMENGKPIWGDHCANCFACLQWCPKQAITLGNTNLNILRYHHPDVVLEDLLKRNKPLNDNEAHE